MYANLNVEVKPVRTEEGPKAKPLQPVTFPSSTLGRTAEMIEGALWVVLCVSIVGGLWGMLHSVLGRSDEPFGGVDLVFSTSCVCGVLALVGLAVTHKKS